MDAEFYVTIEDSRDFDAQVAVPTVSEALANAMRSIRERGAEWSRFKVTKAAPGQEFKTVITAKFGRVP